MLSSSAHTIGYILSLNVGFKAADQVSPMKKTKALGGKYPRIKDIILES